MRWGGIRRPTPNITTLLLAMKKNTAPKIVTNHRDAGTGLFVTKRYAEAHPKTTVTERNKVPPKRK
jgi:hypothetical protein